MRRTAVDALIDLRWFTFRQCSPVSFGWKRSLECICLVFWTTFGVSSLKMNFIYGRMSFERNSHIFFSLSVVTGRTIFVKLFQGQRRNKLPFSLPHVWNVRKIFLSAGYIYIYIYIVSLLSSSATPIIVFAVWFWSGWSWWWWWWWWWWYHDRSQPFQFKIATLSVSSCRNNQIVPSVS